MKHRIVKYLALLIAAAMLLPMAGIAEDPVINEAEAMEFIDLSALEAGEPTIPDVDEPAVPEAEGDVDLPLEDALPGETGEPAPEGEDALTADEPEPTPVEEDEPMSEEDAAEPAAENGDAEGETETSGDNGNAEDPAEPAVAEEPAQDGAAETAADASLEAAPAEEPAQAESVPAVVGLVEEAPQQKAAAEAGPGLPGALTLGLKEKYTFIGGDGFTSSNPKVATVNAAGLVVAKKAGSTTITVTAGGAPVGVCQLTVKKAPKKVKLPKKQTMIAGQTIKLTAIMSGGYCNAPTWTSSNNSVAQVDANGNVTAVGMGKANITVRTHNKKKAVCALTVDSANAPTSVSFPMGTLFVGKGESVQLKPVLNPGAETTFTYTSKKKNVASVGKKTGILKGKKLKKSTKVTVTTQNGKKAAVSVKVIKPATGIAISAGSVTLDLGGATQLSASMDANTASQVSWSSSNPGVVAVSDGNPFCDGKSSAVTIVAVGGGSATVTASTFNGKSASCAVYVNAPAPAPAPAPAIITPPAPAEQQIPIDAASFPNDGFRSWVAANCDGNGDGQLSESEMAAMTVIMIDDPAVESLQGIEYFKNLTTLSSTAGALTAVDLSGNPALKKVDLSGNGSLTALDVSKNPELAKCVVNGDRTEDGGKYTYSYGDNALTVDKPLESGITPAPVTELTQPSFVIGSANVVNGKPLQVSITNAADQVKVVAYSVEVLSGETPVSGVSVTESNGGYTIDTATLMPGDYKVRVTVTRTNYEPKSQTASFTVKPGLVAPTLSITGTTAFTQGKDVTISVAKGTEPAGATCTYTASFTDGQNNPAMVSHTLGMDTLTVDTTDLATGAYKATVTVSAGDDYVNKTSNVIEFTVTDGLVAPTLTLGSASASKGMPITVTVSGNQPVDVSYAAKICQGENDVADISATWDATNKTFTIATDDLTIGTEYKVVVTVSATDYVSRTADAAFTVTEGLAAPTLSASASVSVGMPATVTVSGQQPAAVTYTAKVYQDTTELTEIAPAWNGETNTFTIDTANLTVGTTYTVVVTASASGYADQTAQAAFIVTAGLEKPAFTLDKAKVELGDTLQATITNLQNKDNESYKAAFIPESGAAVEAEATLENGVLTIKTDALQEATYQLVITVSATGYVDVDSDPMQVEVQVITIRMEGFIINVDTHAVVGYEGEGGDIAIPAKDSYANADITAIGAGAFKDNANITSVTIPGTVTEVLASAFESCANLESVTIPNGVTKIGEKAFKNCAKLSSMTTTD